MTLDLAHYLPFLLNRAGTAIAGAFDGVLDGHGLSLPMWRALTAVHREDGRRIGEIASATGVELWTVSRVVKSMEKMGLVDRRREIKDERAVKVHLTDMGRELTERLIPIARLYEEIMLNGFSAREIDALKDMLERLFANIETIAGLDPQPGIGAAAAEA